ncbi:MAG: rhodanese-like domain-containing protein [Bacteroidota bacterium]
MKITDNPKLQGFHLEGVKHISPEEAYESLVSHNAVLIDVRREEEIASEHIPLDNVLYHPMEKIADRLDKIAKDQNIILICKAGIRSTKAAYLLDIHGYPNTANLDGGIKTWKAKGLPCQLNRLSAGGCGCGSQHSDSAKGTSCC